MKSPAATGMARSQPRGIAAALAKTAEDLFNAAAGPAGAAQVHAGAGFTEITRSPDNAIANVGSAFIRELPA